VYFSAFNFSEVKSKMHLKKPKSLQSDLGQNEEAVDQDDYEEDEDDDEENE
jgi:hypothetical protein